MLGCDRHWFTTADNVEDPHTIRRVIGCVLEVGRRPNSLNEFAVSATATVSVLSVLKIGDSQDRTV